MSTAAMMVRETHVEERVAKLEADVGYIRSDISEMKLDIRSLRGSVEKLGERMSTLEISMTDRMGKLETRMIERMNDSFARIDRTIASAKIWALLLYATIAAALLGVLARGFNWL